MEKNTIIPEGYQTVMPYLIVQDATGLLDFMTEVFGAKEKLKEMREGTSVIKHAEVTIGDSTIMFAEATRQWSNSPAGMFIYVNDADAVYKKAIQHGAESIREPALQPYGKSGGVKDPYGNTWWITSQS
jgi:uncharacterized glyoxalase superfamily protein PhnB